MKINFKALKLKHQLTCIHIFVIMKKFEKECQNELLFFADICVTKVHNLLQR